MFECIVQLFRCNATPVDRVAIMAFDDCEASVVTSTTHYKLVRETQVSMDVETGIVRFCDTDGVDVAVLVPDERDRAIVVELVQGLCERVMW